MKNVSYDYVNNIYSRSNISLETNGECYIMKLTLPNSFVLCIVGNDTRHCAELAKEKIRELESYLETDKKFYNYDLGNEYE